MWFPDVSMFDWHKKVKYEFYTSELLLPCEGKVKLDALEQENSTYQDTVCQFKQVHNFLMLLFRKYIFLFHEGSILCAKHAFPAPPKWHTLGKT